MFGVGCVALVLVPADLPLAAEQRGFPPAPAESCSLPPGSTGTARDDDAGRQVPVGLGAQERNESDGRAGTADDHEDYHLDDAESDDLTVLEAARAPVHPFDRQRPTTPTSCRGPPTERPPEDPGDPVL